MNTGLSQDEWMAFPSDSGTVEVIDTLDFTNGKGVLKINEDGRLDKIEKFVRADEETVAGIRIDGYRVLIYFSQDKSSG